MRIYKWDIYIGSRCIAYIFATSDMTEDQVRKSLKHDDFDIDNIQLYCRKVFKN